MYPFAVVLFDPSEEAWNSVREHWADQHHIVSETLAFVVPAPRQTVHEVATQLGLNAEEGGFIGMVFRVEGIGGVGYRTTVDWLDMVGNEPEPDVESA